MKHPSLRLVGGPIVALLVLTATTPIGVEDVSSMDRFELWNVCQPIDLLVEHLGDDAVKMGLTREAIATTVRSRLRATRLYRRSSRPYPYLYVKVDTLSGGGGTAVNVSLEFTKQVLDRISGHHGAASTWDTGAVGWADAASILSTVSQLTDKFIDEYLRVNESACQGPGQG